MVGLEVPELVLSQLVAVLVGLEALQPTVRETLLNILGALVVLVKAEVSAAEVGHLPEQHRLEIFLLVVSEESILQVVEREGTVVQLMVQTRVELALLRAAAAAGLVTEMAVRKLAVQVLTAKFGLPTPPRWTSTVPSSLTRATAPPVKPSR